MAVDNVKFGQLTCARMTDDAVERQIVAADRLILIKDGGGEGRGGVVFKKSTLILAGRIINFLLARQQFCFQIGSSLKNTGFGGTPAQLRMIPD
ncbi:hypothetical protein Zmor_012949 [Zophobas morio]|uniref:Uncharacterized protein n=1 Tax=Zophobas morio TaxID=2755281 RepID=A0AA38IGU7_9CUCU|nr:hypothetical protein Zmor_012949 [Zophobas morio]